MRISGHEFARMCDATLTGAVATHQEMLEMIKQAKKYHFYSVIGQRCYLDEMVEKLKGTDVLVGAGCSNITGADPAEVKANFAKWHLAHGAQEIENIMNISAFKSGLDDMVVRDVRAVRDAIGPNVVYKCILEVCYLHDDEIRHACELLIEGGVDYVKTSTGKAGPATLHHVEVMSEACKGRAKIKAAGGIRSIETVERMLDLGVERFGVGLESAVKIIEEANSK